MAALGARRGGERAARVRRTLTAMYAPLNTPLRRVATGMSSSVGRSWRERMSEVGPSLRITDCTKAPAVSSASAGRITSMLGMTRSAETASTGWCVGPSSPTPIESCVRM